MVDIRIDAPGAGAWIMERAEGYFREGWDHAFSSHDGDRILGGFALVGYLGDSMTIHMGSDDPRWCSRELLWLAFDYAFNQVGCRKLLAPVRSDDHKVIALNLRAGWQIEAVIRDVFPGAHMFVLGMTRGTCPWLKHRPRQWQSLQEAA